MWQHVRALDRWSCHQGENSFLCTVWVSHMAYKPHYPPEFTFSSWCRVESSLKPSIEKCFVSPGSVRALCVEPNTWTVPGYICGRGPGLRAWSKVSHGYSNSSISSLISELQVSQNGGTLLIIKSYNKSSHILLSAFYRSDTWWLTTSLNLHSNPVKWVPVL